MCKFVDSPLGLALGNAKLICSVMRYFVFFAVSANDHVKELKLDSTLILYSPGFESMYGFGNHELYAVNVYRHGYEPFS